MMKTSYDFKRGQWIKKWPESVSKHDLVFQSPIDDPTYGLPIGDGETGCLLWLEKDRLQISVNRCDLWETVSCDAINGENTIKEKATALRHAGRLSIQLGKPVFDLLYQQAFEGRLALAEASATYDATTPFAHARVEAFASNKLHVTALRVCLDAPDPGIVRVKLERWGSRTLPYWYQRICRDTSIGLNGTQAGVADRTFYVTQSLGESAFCLAVSIETDVCGGAKRLDSHSAEYEIAPCEQQAFIVRIAVAKENDEDSARRTALERLARAEAVGWDDAYLAHCRQWREFWQKSQIGIPMNYMENLWYLTLYYANAQLRGAYPAHFCNGLWGWQHDFVPWGHYFHYNMQLTTWPLSAANHGELLTPYFDFRFRQLPKAIAHARRCKHVEGALYTDVSDANGTCDRDTVDNLTPSSQIAQKFWEHYRYTGDLVFLREKAWPIIRAAALLYQHLFEPDAQGVYHIRATQAYEGSPLMDDAITDHVMARKILDIALKCAKTLDIEEPNADTWQTMLSHFAPLLLTPMEPDEMEDGKIAAGQGRGKEIRGTSVLGVGRFTETSKRTEEALKGYKPGDTVRQLSRSKGHTPYYGFPDVELSPLYPAGLITLRDRGTSLFDALVNQARLHERSIVEDDITLKNQDQVACMGWCLNPIYLARLGLAEELTTALQDAVNTWQWYANGFGHYGGYENVLADNNLRFKTNLVSDVDDPSAQRFPFPAWPFRHFDFELLPILCTAMNEMLMQSAQGRIRLFPACPSTWNASFRLLAEGGFLVDAELREGKVSFVSIKSLRGERLRVVNPWMEENEADAPTVVALDPSGMIDWTWEKDGADKLISLDTQRGARYFFAPKGIVPEMFRVDAGSDERNMAGKRLGRARLGVPRMY